MKYQRKEKGSTIPRQRPLPPKDQSHQCENPFPSTQYNSNVPAHGSGDYSDFKAEIQKAPVAARFNWYERFPSKTGPQILKDVTMLQAIYWVNTAWKDPLMSTIEKWFLNSGFSMCNTTSDILQSETSDSSVVPASVVDELMITPCRFILSFELFDWVERFNRDLCNVWYMWQWYVKVG